MTRLVVLSSQCERPRSKAGKVKGVMTLYELCISLQNDMLHKGTALRLGGCSVLVSGGGDLLLSNKRL